MPYKYSFENLDVWKLSKKLAIDIRKLTDKFLKKELFSLIGQMNRSSLSIASNIAEGSTRKSNRDQAHFTTIAYSSAIELLCQLEISYELKYFDELSYEKFRLQIEEITNKLNGLWNYQTKVLSNTTNQLSKSPTKLKLINE